VSPPESVVQHRFRITALQRIHAVSHHERLAGPVRTAHELPELRPVSQLLA
jgi:hypothetical protein